MFSPLTWTKDLKVLWSQYFSIINHGNAETFVVHIPNGWGDNTYGLRHVWGKVLPQGRERERSIDRGELAMQLSLPAMQNYDFVVTQLARKYDELEGAMDADEPEAAVSSEFRGVSWAKTKGKWEAYVYHQGKRHHVGYFDDEAAAARARDAKAATLHGTDMVAPLSSSDT